LIVDTDVLIWYSRGNAAAVDTIHSMDSMRISVITYMEIVQGVRNKKELIMFKRALETLHIQVLQIEEWISSKAMLFVEQYSLSHSMELVDALIAATAIVHKETLLTGNSKHYRHLPHIEIEVFTP
jgi:predicted nucleic acid-binding protein